MGREKWAAGGHVEHFRLRAWILGETAHRPRVLRTDVRGVPGECGLRLLEGGGAGKSRGGPRPRGRSVCRSAPGSAPAARNPRVCGGRSARSLALCPRPWPPRCSPGPAASAAEVSALPLRTAGRRRGPAGLSPVTAGGLAAPPAAARAAFARVGPLLAPARPRLPPQPPPAARLSPPYLHPAGRYPARAGPGRVPPPGPGLGLNLDSASLTLDKTLGPPPHLAGACVKWAGQCVLVLRELLQGLSHTQPV